MSDSTRTDAAVPENVLRAAGSLGPLMQFLFYSAYATEHTDPDACDFAFGNPQEMPLPGFVAALQKNSQPQNKEWFAYKQSEPASQTIVAAGLQKRLGMDFKPEDILMTTGAFAAIATVCKAIAHPGDEIIYVNPGWFLYESIIIQAGAKPVAVQASATTFDLDLDAIAAAITPNTRMVIVNSPNNPTGRIYSAATLQALSDLLTRASAEHGRVIYCMSDEAYRGIVFSGNEFVSPVLFYPATFIVYTYGKVLLTPGQRIGWIALSPNMPGREMLRMSLLVTAMTLGWLFPNAILQYSLPELEALSIDIGAIERRRDRLYAALTAMGYEAVLPQGTFYLTVVSPLEDDAAFTSLLAAHKVFCLPGSISQIPGYFRISLTANDDMVERAIPIFQRVLDGLPG